jgi:hypothetical protein
VRVLSCAVTLALARQQHDARVIICRGSVPVNESSSAASYPGARTRLGSYSPHLLQHRGRPAQTAASPPDRSPLAQAGRGKHRPDRTASTIVQTCLIHLIRNSFRFASRKYWDELSRDLKPIYTPSTPRPPPLPWTTSTPSGAPVIRRSSGSGATHGKSSSRSWTTTWRSARCYAAPTPSKA